MESNVQGSNVPQKTETQILIGLCVKFLVAFLVLMMIDTLVDWAMGLIDLLVDLVHLVIEILEVLVEVVLERYFDASKKQSEIVFLNIVVFVMLGVLYRFIRFFPRIVSKISKDMSGASHTYIESKKRRWKSYSITMRLKLVALYILGFYCLSILVL